MKLWILERCDNDYNATPYTVAIWRNKPNFHAVLKEFNVDIREANDTLILGCVNLIKLKSFRWGGADYFIEEYETRD